MLKLLRVTDSKSKFSMKIVKKEKKSVLVFQSHLELKNLHHGVY